MCYNGNQGSPFLRCNDPHRTMATEGHGTAHKAFFAHARARKTPEKIMTDGAVEQRLLVRGPDTTTVSSADAKACTALKQTLGPYNTNSLHS
jgi:hypothetical protein